MNPGKITGNIRRRSVIGALKGNGGEVLNGAATGGDCAVFAPFAAFPGEMACCAQAAVPGENVASVSHLLQRCVNGLSSRGAAAQAVTVTVLIPPDREEPELKRLMSELGDAAGKLGLAVAGAQASVTDAVACPAVSMTAFGRLPVGRDYSLKNVGCGQQIVLTKWVGLEGTALLARRFEGRLLKRLPACLVREAASFDRYLSVRPEAETAGARGVTAMLNAAEGGILAALWELGECAGGGMEIELKKIPLRQETVEVCECLGVNPYELMSGGSLLLVTDDGPGLQDALARAGIPAVQIGRITDGNDRVVRNGDEIRYLNRPEPDAIYACEAKE